MHHLRRVVTILTSFALLQLTVLGGAMPCTSPMAETGPHAEHAQHASASQPAGATQDIESAPRQSPPASDCVIRACSASPVLLAVSTSAQDPPQPTGSLAPAADVTPGSPFQPLEPPPPRA